jgi:protein phosphatase
MAMVRSGAALCVPGNHDVKLMRKLNGKDVRVTHGLAETLAQLESEPEAFRQEIARFVDDLVSHYVLDGGRLVVAHAGLRADLQGRGSAKVRDFALYGETTGETDDYGLPVRYDWANDYRGEAMVVYGHTPVPEAAWLNRTICIDTGCVFGGSLTALRYPERELVAVPAAREYYAPIRPLLPVAPEIAAPPPERGDLLDLADVAGKRAIATRLHHRVTIRAENAASALEVMSRFAIDPRWLAYLPPTIAPVETCPDGDLLERPQEAFAHFRHEGIASVLCEEKHMGSRAVIVLPRTAEVARSRFGIDGRGAIHTRTGRAFFAESTVEAALLERLATAAERAGWWDTLASDWLLLDAEILPWSAKAGALLDQQYAPTGRAGQAAMQAMRASLAVAQARLGAAVDELRARVDGRADAVERYVAAWQRYCWPSEGLAGLRVAPFHLLAAEREVLLRRPHDWHLGMIDALAAVDGELVTRTGRLLVDLTDPASEAAAVDWWERLTADGGEGMVVKPLASVVVGRRGLVQPGLKVRGREYLRIIYGPEYSLPNNLERLRQRGVGAKRSLALREAALGLEALHRFVECEPLYRVHECVFGVLALESEPVDPRL